jgi:hypothetical protein
MKLERMTSRDGNLYPEVFNYLRLLPDEVLFHSAHKERHPFSIYTLSLQRLTKAFKDLLDEIKQISAALLDVKGNFNYRLDKIPELQEELLRSLESHIDDCHIIIRVLHKPEQWETWKKKHLKRFNAAIKGYRDSFARIINKIKHNYGRIRPVMMYSPGKNLTAYSSTTGIKIPYRNPRIVGYFLEGVHSDGCIGPDTDIHPSGNTAISLNRDVRRHFANLYRIGHYLKCSVVESVYDLYQLDLPQPGRVESTSYNYEIEQIAERINQLPPLFFQNEFSESTPVISYYRNQQGADLVIDFLDSYNVSWDGKAIVHAEFQVDSVCLQYRPPYLGQ